MLVLLVMVAFFATVIQRVRHIANKQNRHLWRLLYEKTGLLLDIAIVGLHGTSES